MAQTVKRLPTMPTMWETRVQSLGRKISWRRKWQPSPVFLPGKSHGQRSLVGYSPSGRKGSDATERLHVYQLRKAATSPPIEDLQVQCACVWICTCAHERAKREQGVKERNAASM